MYGNTPDCWSVDLDGLDRLRFSINCFTRLRFCDAAGCLALEEKGPPGSQAAGYRPWFDIENRRSRDLKIIFGHWSTLRLVNDNYETKGVFPLDTGCVWGGALTALRLEDQRYFSVPSRQPRYKFTD
jgi:bis(5'-nucleosyl)-tetraphosphatase (symmetrical)